jgi:SAM-dependent methyltransferase
MSRIVLEPLQKSSLADWFATEAGRYVLDWELAQFDNAVEDVFGFNAVQVGLPGTDFLRANRMPNRFTAGEPGCGLVADPAHLPLASHSLDLVVLPHVLEFCRDPHQVLREAERVLMPEGQIVIAGFNPLSLWGLTRLSRRRSASFPWRGEFIGLLRLRDWLKLLGFELNGGKFGCYAPAFAQERWLQRFGFMEKAGDRWWPIAGGVYVIRAVKRTAGMRLVAPSWRTPRREARALAAVASRTGSSRSLRLIRGDKIGPLSRPVPSPAPSLRPVPAPESGEPDGV